MTIQNAKYQLDESRRNRIKQILDGLCDGLIEREEEMKLTFLSAIAGQTIFLLGPPGVAKSLIARRLKYAFKNAKTFEYLMHRFSTPDEVFGPISIGKLKKDDKLERVVDYYLPGANIAFLDEIWKAGPSIQNTLLTIINEKIFRNGEQEIKVDLFGIISASNELPAEGQGLDALWDRFLVRILINNIEERSNFEKMILETKDLYADSVIKAEKITRDEYFNWQTKRDEVDVPHEILELINHVRIKITSYNKDQENVDKPKKPIYVSDRRWKKIITLLRTSAFLNGRFFVDLMDCFLIPYAIWDDPEQIDLTKKMVEECIRHQGYTIGCDISSIQNELHKLSLEIKQEIRIENSVRKDGLVEYSGFYSFHADAKSFYIKISDFDNLSLDVATNVQLYETPDLNPPSIANVRRRQNPKSTIMKKISYNTIEITGNQYKLIEERLEQKVYITKKPHALIIEAWDKRISNLKQELHREFQKIKKFIDDDLRFIKMNIFIPENNADVIFSKLEDMNKNLHQLEIKIDEQSYLYHNIKDGEILESKSSNDNSDYSLSQMFDQ